MDIERFDKTQPEDVSERCEGAQIIVNKEMPLTKETISQLPSTVKLICEAGAGYNNIDLDACQAECFIIQCADVRNRGHGPHGDHGTHSLLCSFPGQQAAAFGCGDFLYLEQSAILVI